MKKALFLILLCMIFCVPANAAEIGAVSDDLKKMPEAAPAAPQPGRLIDQDRDADGKLEFQIFNLKSGDIRVTYYSSDGATSYSIKYPAGTQFGPDGKPAKHKND